MSTKRKPVINAHCHFLNLDFIPDKMVRLLTPISEDMARDEKFQNTADRIKYLIPGKNYDRIKSFLINFSSNIDMVTENYIKTMDKAGIDVCVPLMIDFEPAMLNIINGKIPFYNYNKDETDKNPQDQIDLISRQVAKYPWRIFPFIMFDPRRKNAFEICKEAIEKKGFIGIKMYPAIGYHPCPQINRDPGYFWDKIIPRNEKVADELEKLYLYCKSKRIPITTHVDFEGAYSSSKIGNTSWILNDIEKLTKLDRIRETKVWRLTEVSNWLIPIREFSLKINFAHLGGNYMHHRDIQRIQALSWRRQILNLILESNIEKNGHGNIYTDLSYHYMALTDGSREQDQYFEDLRRLLKDKRYCKRLMFGTDASMLSHTWSEDEYIKAFKKSNYLDKRFQERIFSDNPVSFLFEDGKIPDSYSKFIRKTNGNFEKLPDWVVKRGIRYYIVSSKTHKNKIID